MNVEDVRRAYFELGNQRRVIIDQERYKMEQRVAEAMLPYERKFSEVMHAAFAEGVSKTELRAASRQGRNAGFTHLWNLHTDQATLGKGDSYVWVDDTTLTVYTSGTEAVARDVEWFVETLDDNSIRRTATFRLDDDMMYLYPLVYKQAEQALNDKEAEND